MNADGTCAVERGAEDLGQPAEGAQEGIEGSGDGGGAIRADTVAGEESADVAERGLGGLHRVVAAAAMDVDIEERRDQRGVGEIDVAAGLQSHRGARFDRGDEAVFDDDNRMIDGVVGSKKARRSKNRSHRARVRLEVSSENGRKGARAARRREPCGRGARCVRGRGDGRDRLVQGARVWTRGRRDERRWPLRCPDRAT